MNEHIVKSYEEELTQLAAEVARMGGLAEAQVAACVQAVAKRDVAGAEAVIARDERLDAMEIEIDGEVKATKATGDGPVDATFNAIKQLTTNTQHLQIYQVHAVTGGTDAQAEVMVRLEENGKTVQGQGADADTLVASAKAYINALNKLLVKREKSAPAAMSA